MGLHKKGFVTPGEWYLGELIGILCWKGHVFEVGNGRNMFSKFVIYSGLCTIEKLFSQGIQDI